MDGVACYNDSKATNVDATLVALTAFLPTRPIVLLGGRDQGHRFGPPRGGLRRERPGRGLLRRGPRAVPSGFRGLGGLPVLSAGTMEEALDAALSIAEDGDVVVLSPACASFDEFSCFEERGDVFKRLVADRAGKA